MSFLTSPKQRFTLCLDIEKGQGKVGEGPLCFRNVETVTDAPHPNPVFHPLFTFI